MTSTSIDTRKSDFFLSREAILLYIGKVTQERLASFHELGYVMREILPTPEGLQRLQEIRGNGALRRQLLLIFHDPEDLAARHNWLQFWRGMEQLKGITSILVSDRPGENIAEWGMQWRVQEVFHPSMANVDILKRVNQLIDFQDLVERKKNHSLPDTRYRVPLIKRIFDITVAGTALLMLSPILIIVMILIKLSLSISLAELKLTSIPSFLSDNFR